MKVVKGYFRDGVALPEEPIADRDGQWVLITFLDEQNIDQGNNPNRWRQSLPASRRWGKIRPTLLILLVHWLNCWLNLQAMRLLMRKRGIYSGQQSRRR